MALLGARQVGKSTLAQTLGNAYYTLDDFATRAFAREDPTGFATSLPSGAIIDEVQRVPDLLPAIKNIVDRDRSPGRFIITGSANILTLPQISESLAGRMRILEVYPLAEAEIESRPKNAVDELFESLFVLPESKVRHDDILERILRGGYPEAVLSSSVSMRERWFENYLTAMIHREIRELTRISDIGDIERLLRTVIVRTGQLVSPTALSSVMGIPKETLRRYFRMLEQLYLIHIVPAWATEPGRVYIKAGKFYANDTGIAAYQLGVDGLRIAEQRDLIGNLLETFAMNEIQKQVGWSMTRPRIYHLRTTSGKEVDIVLQSRDGRAVAIEVKATASPGAADTRMLRELVGAANSPYIRGILLYSGTQALPIAKNIYALPFSWLWQA